MARDRDYTHCRDCGRRWTGKTECHCAKCCTHFGSPTAFDRHQLAGVCIPAHEMIEPVTAGGPPRLTPVTRQSGTVWIIGRRTHADTIH